MTGFEGNGFNCTGNNGKEITLFFIHIHELLVSNTLMLPIDIPECDRGLDECDMNANCINNFGSYNCMCNTGFTGDGFSCTGMQKSCVLQHAFIVVIAKCYQFGT